jgi:hypothetical protein
VLREAEAAESAEQHFKSKLRLHGIEGEWHLLADRDSAALIELAKSVDLTIAGQRPPNSQSNGASRFRPEDIVIAAGRPVLIVPYAGAFETVGKRILIAWDGTREATRSCGSTETRKRSINSIRHGPERGFVAADDKLGRFAIDSLLEGDGFELSVPRRKRTGGAVREGPVRRLRWVAGQ